MSVPKLPINWRRQAYQLEPAGPMGKNDEHYVQTVMGGALMLPIERGWDVVMHVQTSMQRSSYGQHYATSRIDFFADGIFIGSRPTNNVVDAVRMAEAFGRIVPNSYVVAGVRDAGNATFDLTRASDLLDHPAKEREWHVPGLIPAGEPALFSGDGGTGKSLGALQLGVATVAGRRWFGHEVRQGPVIVMSAEDDAAEIQRRLQRICEKEGIDRSYLSNLHVNAKPGGDALLGILDPDSRIIEPTTLFGALERSITEVQPALIVLDTLADLFGGDENVRNQARQFVGLLRKLTQPCGSAVLCLAHPSVAGIQSGTGTSGSTGWSNSVRARIYLERVFEYRGRGDRRQLVEPDPNARVLTTKKNNYGPIGASMRLRWNDGVLELDQLLLAGPKAADVAAASEASADAVDEKFLELLAIFRDEGQNVSASGPTYAPTKFAKDARAAGIKKAGFAAAMARLFVAKRIALVTYGRNYKRIEEVAA